MYCSAVAWEMGWIRIFCVVYVCASCVRTARVRSPLGDVDGAEYLTDSGRRVYTFLGVPYAQPPIGKNRFEESKPMNSWRGVWQAKKQRPSCAQFNTLVVDAPEKMAGDENCLYLNVYTPTVTNLPTLPVLVYFHGGAFMMGGSAGLKPDFLLDQIDLVFVSVNYRLGPFGFLSTQDDVVPGNNGLKDQVLALKWVHENIVAFGGNRSAVTISGNSAGGASVHYHYLSPLSRGLFQRGISSSGTALMPWAFTEEPLLKAKMLANAIDCPTDSSQEMVKCLKLRRTNDILSKIEPLFMPWLYNPFSPFGPVVENNTDNSFLDEHPYQLLKRGAVHQGPWLTSITTEEGLYPGASFIDSDDYMKSLNTDWNQIAPHLLDYNFTIPDSRQNNISAKIRKFYLGDKEISQVTSDKVIEMLGDRLFKADMDLATRIQASVSPFPVFFFTFGYRGNTSLSDTMSKTKSNFGVSHFDDIYYVLSTANSATMKSESDVAMIKTMSQIWTSFIENGLPSISKGIEWEPVSRDAAFTGNIDYLFINGEGKLDTRTAGNYGNKEFWTTLGFNENANFI